VTTAPYAQPLIKKASFGWLPERFTAFITSQEGGTFSAAAQSKDGSQLFLSVFRPGGEPALGKMRGAVPAKAVRTRPVNGRRAHWLQPPSHRAGEARLRFELRPGQWAELELNAWKRGNVEGTIRRVAETVKPQEEPAAFPLQISGLPRGFVPAEAHIATTGSSIGWETALSFSPLLTITLSQASGSGPSRRKFRRAPNTTFNGHPAYQRASRGNQMLCVYGLQGLDLCLETRGAKAKALLTSLGGLPGLAKRVKVLGADPSRWTTSPLTR
jgi:hypothetical protein